MPGLAGDETMEDLLSYIRVVVMRMSDYTTDWLGKERIYPSRKRMNHFATVKIKFRGYQEDEFQADAGVFLYSGLLLSHIKCVPMAKCDFHGDAHINPRETNGANVNVCPNHLVNMNYPNKSRSVTGRRSLN